MAAHPRGRFVRSDRRARKPTLTMDSARGCPLGCIHSSTKAHSYPFRLSPRSAGAIRSRKRALGKRRAIIAYGIGVARAEQPGLPTLRLAAVTHGSRRRAATDRTRVATSGAPACIDSSVRPSSSTVDEMAGLGIRFSAGTNPTRLLGTAAPSAVVTRFGPSSCGDDTSDDK